MLSLIRKDFMLQKRILMLMLPLLFVALYIHSSVIWVGALFCIAIIMQSFSADEKPSTHLLLNSLPYTRKEIVSSKYIGACVFTFLILATIFFGHWIIYKEMIQLGQLVFIVGMVFLFISFAFPISYLFNSKYLLIASGILFIAYLVVINLFVPNLNDIFRKITRMILTLENYQLYSLMAVSIIVLYFFSWMLSVRIYSRKVF